MMNEDENECVKKKKRYVERERVMFDMFETIVKCFNEWLIVCMYVCVCVCVCVAMYVYVCVADSE